MRTRPGRYLEMLGGTKMINFKQIELKDKKWIDPLLTAADMRGCHHNFVNLFAWSAIYNYQAACLEDYLLVKGEYGEDQGYFYPAGQGNLRTVLEAMGRDAAGRGSDFVLIGLSPENIIVLNSLFPGNFEYREMRDSFDYVYLLDKLVNLTGKEYQAKRNHINRFKKSYLWSYEEINSENLDECWQMNVAWCLEHGCKNDETLLNENCAVRRCFENYRALGLEGGLLRVAGRVIAYTMGDKLNSDTFDIHIEKAMGEIQGAYQMINREFAAFIHNNHPEIIFVNREEDMGNEGLRKAKLSYHPVRMEEKYLGKFTGALSV